MRIWGIAAVAVLATANSALAQRPFVYRPIDTTQMVVQPTEAAATVAGGATAGTLRTIGRVVADTIEDNGFVRTINNLLGKRADPPTVQAGYSPLPLPTAFQSTKYPNTFKPMMPVLSKFGKTPNVPLPTGPTGQK
jgi:hypothetical protein